MSGAARRRQVVAGVLRAGADGSWTVPSTGSRGPSSHRSPAGADATPVVDPDTFSQGFLAAGRPLVSRGCLSRWSWRPPWDPAELARLFAGQRVPLYDTLFSLRGLSTFDAYVQRYTNGAAGEAPPYLRWFARQSDHRLPWADEAFAALASSWSMPEWLPRSGYVLPRSAGELDSARDAFPARGLFVCGPGGRTRLHADPWGSDACLCQVTGDKRLTMFSPDAAELLSDGASVIDLDAPDDGAFPRWREARPDVDEILHPGDAAFIPGGWLHTAVALQMSVSITWNFVHESHRDGFDAFLRDYRGDDPTLSYFGVAGAL